MTATNTITIYENGTVITLPADYFVYDDPFSDPAPVTEADDKDRWEAMKAGEAV